MTQKHQVNSRISNKISTFALKNKISTFALKIK